MISLFEYYPLLREKLPYISLGIFPTPIKKLNKLGQVIGCNNLYIKRDDLSGEIYGGNKIRKLEFILKHALNNQKKEVITFGLAGSSHALATAIYAEQVGLKSISMLLPQPNAHYVRDNLLLGFTHGSELHQQKNTLLLAIDTGIQFIKHKIKHGKFPYFIPPGGSSVLGIIGLVNAAFELKKQIDEGILPVPDYIYVPVGSMGTSVGLMLGLKAANLSSQVVPIRVVDKKYANVRGMYKLFKKTYNFLRSQDSSFSQIKFSINDFQIRHDFFGQRYALFTEEGTNAMKLINNNEDIKLEGTYTGKTLAALISDISKKNLENKTILFWNTYNSREYDNSINNNDFHKLPKTFHKYFINDVQSLDKTK